MKNFQLKFIKNRSLIRRLQLLNEFEKNPSSTLGDLSEVTKSSTRTIIADIAMNISMMQSKSTPRSLVIYLKN